MAPDAAGGLICGTIVRMNRPALRRRLIFAFLTGALGLTSGCAHEEDLRRYGVAAIVVVPRGGEVRAGEGGAIVAFKGGEKYGWAYGVSIIPAGQDHDINEWARTVPGQKEATQFTERADGADGWTLAWTEPSAGGTPRFRFAVYRRSLNLVCTTSADPTTAENTAAARKVCASLRAP